MIQRIVQKIKTKKWGKMQNFLMTGHEDDDDDQKKQVKSFR